jgi:hypothetical protein
VADAKDAGGTSRLTVLYDVSGDGKADFTGTASSEATTKRARTFRA